MRGNCLSPFSLLNALTATLYPEDNGPRLESEHAWNRGSEGGNLGLG